MAVGMNVDKYRTVNLGIYLDQWIEKPTEGRDRRNGGSVSPLVSTFHKNEVLVG